MKFKKIGKENIIIEKDILEMISCLTIPMKMLKNKNKTWTSKRVAEEIIKKER